MNDEKILLKAVLGFPIRSDYSFPIRSVYSEVALAIKKYKIGAGCLNGYGGGIKGAETPEGAIIREFAEESGSTTTLAGLQKISFANFHNRTSEGSVFVCRVHIFLILAWCGELSETVEMGPPNWFDISNLPFSQMMPADRDWVPPLLYGRKIRKIEVWYGPGQKELLRPTVIEYV